MRKFIIYLPVILSNKTTTICELTVVEEYFKPSSAKQKKQQDNVKAPHYT